MQVQVIATTLYFTLGQGFGYLVLTRFYEAKGGSATFLFGSSLLALNLIVSYQYQPRIANKNAGRLYGIKDSPLQPTTLEVV